MSDRALDVHAVIASGRRLPVVVRDEALQAVAQIECGHHVDGIERAQVGRGR